MMVGRTLLASLVVLGVGCSSPAGVSTDDSEAFCETTLELERVYEAANDQLLTAAAAKLVRENVAALQPLIPDEYADDYRLRYWPTTNVTGLDTSGVSAQRAYDRMRTFFEDTCGSQ